GWFRGAGCRPCAPAAEKPIAPPPLPTGAGRLGAEPPSKPRPSDVEPAPRKPLLNGFSRTPGSVPNRSHCAFSSIYSSPPIGKRDIYQAMSRAKAQGEILHNDVDRQDFLKTPAEACLGGQGQGWPLDHATREDSKVKSCGLAQAALVG